MYSVARLPKTINAYYPEVYMDNGILIWVIAKNDLGAIEGTGKIQLFMQEGNKVRKSEICDIQIHGGIMR